jgi:hypothetical protein
MACYRRRRRGQTNPRPVLVGPRNCPGCGARFIPTNPKQEICSARCRRNLHYRRQVAAGTARHRDPADKAPGIAWLRVSRGSPWKQIGKGAALDCLRLLARRLRRPGTEGMVLPPALTPDEVLNPAPPAEGALC